VVRRDILSTVLLLDDHDELPVSPTAAERALAARLGTSGLRAIDAALEQHVRRGQWLKAARVVADAMKAGGFPLTDNGHVELHVRRLVGLVDAGVLEAQGTVRKPRHSEVRKGN
jgi:hypothetical protein